MNKDYRSIFYSSYVSTHLTKISLDERLKTRRPYLEKIVHKHFPKDRTANILELGCGFGALVHIAHQAGYTNIKGVDVSQEQVSEAHRLGIDSVQQGDLFRTLEQILPNSLDFVIAFDVIEHFTKTELLEFTVHVHRVLKKGGCWLCHQPNATSPFFGRIRYGDYTHEQAFTVSSITQLMLAGGFESVSCHEDTIAVHGAKSLLRLLLWHLVRFCLRTYLLAETGVFDEILTQNFIAVVTK